MMTATHFPRRWLTITLAVLLCGPLSGAAPRKAEGLAADRNRPLPHGVLSIEQLVAQLGSPHYAQREKARDQLRQLGVSAFDALHAAQQHPDVEIRKQAEYLLRAIPIAWVDENDPQEVKVLLERYEQQEYDGRVDVLNQLGRIDTGRAIPVLSRLARFETSEELSKHAALAVVRYDLAEQEVEATELAAEIRATIGQSARTAVTWLRAHAHSLHDPLAALPEWQTLVDREIAAAVDRPEKTRKVIVQELARWHIERLREFDRHDEMRATFQKLLPLQGGSREELIETASWLVDRRAWTLLDDLVQAFAKPFEEDPFLLYRRAEAAKHQGQTEQAQALADRAIAYKADEEPFLHVELAYDLQNRGMFEWAERQYRHTIETFPPNSHPPVEAGIRLGWMFHDLARHREAYEAFKDLVERMKNQEVERRAQELNHPPVQILGLMHFSRALHLAEQKRWDDYREELETSLKFDRENADIVIAMYRVPDADKEWRESTLRRIELLREEYAQQVARAEADARTMPGMSTHRNLAQMLNQYAWLISNTVGDYAEALRASQRSLDLVGERAGFLDTLARCYYALGDYATALKHQRRAVALEPHTGQIRRQLELFEQTVKEKGPGTPQAPPPRQDRSPS